MMVYVLLGCLLCSLGGRERNQKKLQETDPRRVIRAWALCCTRVFFVHTYFFSDPTHSVGSREQNLSRDDSLDHDR